jgi:hypothetical protein
VEFKRRDSQEKSILPLDEVISHIQAQIASLGAAIQTRLGSVPYPD